MLMDNEFQWKKGAFSNVYVISGGKWNGRLKTRNFSYSANGILNDKKYVFNAKGIFKTNIEIIDFETRKLIGKIEFNNWKQKARVVLKGVTLIWKSTNFWGTHWSLSDQEEILIKSKTNSFTTKGIMKTKDTNPLVILIGLYIKSYYIKVNAAAASM